MPSNYLPIITTNLKEALTTDPQNLAVRLAAAQDGEALVFQAFGKQCRIARETVTLDGLPETGPQGVVISLYARHAVADPCQTSPWQAFAELPHSRPYVGAFASHTETPLVPYVERILAQQSTICNILDGGLVTDELGGDIAFFITPLPKIRLAYIFYRADEEFPASAKCLFAANAHRFLPVDGLADAGEYTSRAIIQLVSEQE